MEFNTATEVCIYVLRLVDVSFSGGGYHAVVRDVAPQTPYDAPHWLDANGDGDATDPGDRMYPVSYRRNRRVHVRTRWSLQPPGAFDGVTSGEGMTYAGIWFPKTVVSIAGTTVTYEADSDTSLPNVIAMHDPLSIHWWLTNGRVGPVWTGMSQNPVYVTLGDPLAANFHTLVRIGCSKAAGLTETTPTAEHIWGEFTDRVVMRVDAPTTLTYYAGDFAHTTTTLAGLLSTSNGNCHAWAEFLRCCWEVQGIGDGAKIWIGPAVVAGHQCDGFLAKNWTFTGPGESSGTLPFAYVVYDDVTAAPGAPGQGVADPVESLFGCHFIIRYNHQYFDPSYGSGPFGTQLQWENASVDGVFFSGYFRGQSALLTKQKDTGTTETHFEVVP